MALSGCVSSPLERLGLAGLPLFAELHHGRTATHQRGNADPDHAGERQ